LDLDEEHEKHTSGAKALGRFAGFMYGLKPVPFNASSSSAACKALGRFVAFSARLKPCPDTKQSELGLNKSQVSKKRPGAPSVFWIGLVFKGNRRMEHRFDALKDGAVCNRGPACWRFSASNSGRGFAAYTILQSLLDGFLRGLNGLRKKVWIRTKNSKSIPQGLKPSVVLLGLCTG